MNRPPFTLDGYRATVAGLLDRGYMLRSFRDPEPDRRHLILRHDIDQSIQLARRLGELEAGYGWTATYFVLMRTEMYNPWSDAATADLRALVRLGHDVGLHLDSRLYRDADALEAGAQTECAALETILDAPVTALSFHRPPKEKLGGGLRLGGRLNAYADRFVAEMGYCSDSRGEWRFGHPWDHPAVAEGRALQLLTHPVWWVGETASAPVRRLDDALRQRISALDEEMSANNTVWSGRPETRRSP